MMIITVHGTYHNWSQTYQRKIIVTLIATVDHSYCGITIHVRYSRITIDRSKKFYWKHDLKHCNISATVTRGLPWYKIDLNNRKSNVQRVTRGGINFTALHKHVTFVNYIEDVM